MNLSGNDELRLQLSDEEWKAIRQASGAADAVDETAGLGDDLDLSTDLVDFRQQYEIDEDRRKTAKLETEVATIKHELTERVDLHRIRKKHSSRLFILISVWILAVWATVAFQGFGGFSWGEKHWPFALSDTVLIAFITSTTASVLGLYGIAAYWMFGKPRNGDNPAIVESKKSDNAD